MIAVVVAHASTVQILVSGGALVAIATVVAAVVAGLFSKRKLGAEATEIITRAAAGVVTNLEAQLERQAATHAADVAKLTARHEEDRAQWNAKLEGFERDVHEWSELHMAWDTVAIVELAKHGVNLDPAPPPLRLR